MFDCHGRKREAQAIPCWMRRTRTWDTTRKGSECLSKWFTASVVMGNSSSRSRSRKKCRWMAEGEEELSLRQYRILYQMQTFDIVEWLDGDGHNRLTLQEWINEEWLTRTFAIQGQLSVFSFLQTDGQTGSLKWQFFDFDAVFQEKRKMNKGMRMNLSEEKYLREMITRRVSSSSLASLQLC